MKDVLHKIDQLATKALEGSDYYVVDIKYIAAFNKVQLFLESDTAVTIDRCAIISRIIEKVLDEEKWLGEKYILEVSSAGMDNPLKVLRQYHKHLGKLMSVVTNDGSNYEGRMTMANDSIMTLIPERTIKNKVIKGDTLTFTYDQIKTCKRIINF